MVLYGPSRGRLSPAQWAGDIPDSDALRWLGQGISPADRPCTAFGTGCLSRSSRCTPGRSNRPWLKGSPPPKRPCSTAHRFGPGQLERHHLVNEDKLTKRLQELNAAVAQDAAGQPSESQPYWMAATPSGRQTQLERYRQAGDEIADRLAKNQERPKDKQLPRKQVKVSITDPRTALPRAAIKRKFFVRCTRPNLSWIPHRC